MTRRAGGADWLSISAEFRGLTRVAAEWGVKKRCYLVTCFLTQLFDCSSGSGSLLLPPRVAELTSLPPRRAATPSTLSDAMAQAFLSMGLTG